VISITAAKDFLWASTLMNPPELSAGVIKLDGAFTTV
jgi:hypothetical protein